MTFLPLNPLLLIALENKCKTAEKKADLVFKEKKRLEGELEALTKKTHDASGQLVLISQELLKKERSVCRGQSWRHRGSVCIHVPSGYHQRKCRVALLKSSPQLSRSLEMPKCEFGENERL